MNLLNLKKAVLALNKVLNEHNVTIEEKDFKSDVDGFYYRKKLI